MTKAVYKAQAKRLAEVLSRVHGVKLKPSSMLEAVAGLHGRPDWNTLLACGPADQANALPSLLPQASTSALDRAATGEQTNLERFESWLRQALSIDASALDIRPNEHGYEVFMRTDGIRRRCHSGSLPEYDALRALLYWAAGKDGDAAAKFETLEFQAPPSIGDVVVKVSATAYDSGRSHLFIRWYSPLPRFQGLDDLGLAVLPEWKQGIARPSGLCLVAGGAGSGRTSTVVATARALLAEGRRVVVRTDEIDSRWVPGAVFKDKHLSAGDVVVLGELRYHDHGNSIEHLITQGVLVIAEVHAMDSESAIARLADLGFPTSVYERGLNVVLAQQLVPRARTGSEGKLKGPGSGGQPARLALSESRLARPGRPIFSKEWSFDNFVDDAHSKIREGLVSRHEMVRIFGKLFISD